MSQELPDSWIKIWDTDGDSILVDAENANIIDASVSKYIDSGRTLDSLLALPVGPTVFYTMASRITAWILSTPEYREWWDRLHEKYPATNKKDWED